LSLGGKSERTIIARLIRFSLLLLDYRLVEATLVLSIEVARNEELRSYAL
jgi:hypothetical protein